MSVTKWLRNVKNLCLKHLEVAKASIDSRFSMVLRSQGLKGLKDLRVFIGHKDLRVFQGINVFKDLKIFHSLKVYNGLKYLESSYLEVVRFQWPQSLQWSKSL